MFRLILPYLEGKLTLELGPGDGACLGLLGKDAIGVDLSVVNVEEMRKKGLTAIVHDLNLPLPFADGHFQAVFASHLLEHIERPIQLLREIERVLCQGGTLVLVQPIEKSLPPMLREGYFRGHPTHLYGFSADGLERILDYTGFRPLRRFFQVPFLWRLPFGEGVLRHCAFKGMEYLSSACWLVAEKRAV
jgi:SAM-dependent methyltransferase